MPMFWLVTCFHTLPNVKLSKCPCWKAYISCWVHLSPSEDLEIAVAISYPKYKWRVSLFLGCGKLHAMLDMWQITNDNDRYRVYSPHTKLCLCLTFNTYLNPPKTTASVRCIPALPKSTPHVQEFVGPLSRWIVDSKTAPRFVKYNVERVLHRQGELLKQNQQ